MYLWSGYDHKKSHISGYVIQSNQNLQSLLYYYKQWKVERTESLMAIASA